MYKTRLTKLTPNVLCHKKYTNHRSAAIMSCVQNHVQYETEMYIFPNDAAC